MKVAFILLLAVHGVIHLIGFAKAFRIAELPTLRLAIGRTAGALWLLAGALFLATAALLAVSSREWWIAGAAAIVLSQTLIIASWPHAKAGTIANVIALVPVALALIDLRPSSFRSLYEREAERGMARPIATEPVVDADLETLPPLVATYMRRVGVVGRPRVHDFRARFVAEMKPSRDAGFMKATVEQTSFFDAPTRLFLMDASRSGVPFQAFHRYVGPRATMQVRIASLFDVVDARGPEMDQSETVTLFNDMCLLAPSTLLDADVTWHEVDARTVHATFTNAGHTISADLTFDDAGDLSGFVSNDRSQSADGKRYLHFPWSTPVRDYRDCGGLRLASHGDAIWKEPAGDFLYGRFELLTIEVDVARRGHASLASRR